jgi:hypothetical protein
MFILKLVFIDLALVPNRKVVAYILLSNTVSSIELLCVEQFIIRLVLKLPPRDSYNKRVSLESR